MLMSMSLESAREWMRALETSHSPLGDGSAGLRGTTRTAADDAEWTRMVADNGRTAFGFEKTIRSLVLSLGERLISHGGSVVIRVHQSRSATSAINR
jgi:hypothetical protein